MQAVFLSIGECFSRSFNYVPLIPNLFVGHLQYMHSIVFANVQSPFQILAQQNLFYYMKSRYA